MRVRAAARLHLGFLDLHGGLGRRFGSFGLALDDGPGLELELAPAAALTSSGPESERLIRYALEAAARLGLPSTVSLRLTRTIPAHAGFGSGTQLALAVAAGLARLAGQPIDLDEAAIVLDRGNRSGVGLAVFTGGGFILDGGRGDAHTPPPILARLPFPAAWRIVLVEDPNLHGVHGAAEAEAFRRLPAFPEEEAAAICRHVLMQVLPGLAQADLAAFGAGVSAVQRRLGAYFAPCQGGAAFTSPVVAAAMEALPAQGVAGIGQSSWGPTAFAIVGTEAEARRLARDLASGSGAGARLRITVARGRNRGAEIDTLPSRQELDAVAAAGQPGCNIRQSA